MSLRKCNQSIWIWQYKDVLAYYLLMRFIYIIYLNSNLVVSKMLLESDKTIYYERCTFVIEVPTIYETVNGNRLTLTIGGVRTYNHTNLYSKKGAERFKVFIDFTCKVCTNLCVSTDGYLSCLEVINTRDLYQAVLEMFHKYDAAKHIHLMQSLGNTSMTEHQFCQLLGRMRLYQCLLQGYQKAIPRMLLTDTQVNNVAKAYINNKNFGSLGNDLSMQCWQLLVYQGVAV